MRKPARIESWLTPAELLSWLKEAPPVAAYQKRLAVWLTYLGPFHAQEVARMLGVKNKPFGFGWGNIIILVPGVSVVRDEVGAAGP